MSKESCDGTYNSNSLLCRWFCRVGIQITRRRKLERKAEHQQERSIIPEPHTEEENFDELRAEQGNPLVAALPLPQPRCYGEYVGDSAACISCGFKTECSRCPHGADSYGASSSFVFYPTGSSAVDTEATTVEGGSNMNSNDFATRKAKAQDLEVVSVGNDFMVKSSTRQGGYMVTAREEGGHHCACMDFATHRGDSEWKCKHIIAVEEYLEKRGPTNGDSRYDIIDIE